MLSNRLLISVDMTVRTVSDVAAARIREVRKRRGWQPADLAARCAKLGADQLTENVIENLEGGRRRGGKRRRDLTVDELFALALALNVFPTHLLVPTDDSDEPYRVTATVKDSNFRVRCWVRGLLPLSLPKVGDVRQLWSEVPAADFEAMQQGQCPCCGGRPPRDLGGRKDERDGER
jgi:transcriptional regulator with XRE-family HTH domain